MPNLVEYLCKKGNRLIEPRLYSSLKTLGQSVAEGMVDVLLAGEEVREEILQFLKQIPQIILLSEGSYAREETEFEVIFKYQPVSDIMKELMSLIAENDMIPYTRIKLSKSKTEVYGVYAPYGGAGVTSCALALAKRYAENYQTLYVNLELFNSFDFSGQGRRTDTEYRFRGMSEVLFYLKQKKEKLAIKLDSITYSREGIDYLLAVEDYRDLYHMETEDMHRFLEVLLSDSPYQRIIFDIGYLGEATLYLMQQADGIYMPEPKQRLQAEKQNAFFGFLAREHREEILKKIVQTDDRGGI